MRFFFQSGALAFFSVRAESACYHSLQAKVHDGIFTLAIIH